MIREALVAAGRSVALVTSVSHELRAPIAIVQAHLKRRADGPRAGRGLAIVREFVEEMGDRVMVKSAPGEGTCFRFYLAAAPE